MSSFLSVGQAATYLGVSEKLIRSEMERGKISFKRIGRLIRISQPALDAYLRMAEESKEEHHKRHKKENGENDSHEKEHAHGHAHHGKKR